MKWHNLKLVTQRNNACFDQNTNGIASYPRSCFLERALGNREICANRNISSGSLAADDCTTWNSCTKQNLRPVCNGMNHGSFPSGFGIQVNDWECERRLVELKNKKASWLATHQRSFLQYCNVGFWEFEIYYVWPHIILYLLLPFYLFSFSTCWMGSHKRKSHIGGNLFSKERNESRSNTTHDITK